MLSPQLTKDLSQVLLTLVSPRPAPLRLLADDLSEAAGQTVTQDEVEDVRAYLQSTGIPLGLMNAGGRHLFVPRDEWRRVKHEAERAARAIDETPFPEQAGRRLPSPPSGQPE